jgi:murein L,D-transpeptidase YafK
MRKLLYNLVVLFLFFSCHAQEAKLVNHDLSLTEILDSLHINESKISILIDKSDFRLYIRYNDRVLKEYPVVFGKNTHDDKLMQGDNCTPEGTFKIITKYPHKSWSKFIWINYPNEDSWRKYHEAKKTGRIPADAQIGGEVGIHGVPEGMDYLIDTGYNWTLGCISLKNKDINEIYPYISKTTKIEIRK